jgi:predicted transcriptional regulator
MKTEAFTVRTESKKVKQLDKLADRLDRSRNYLVNQAIDHLLDLNAWQEEQTRTGIQAADERLLVNDAEMARIFNKYADEAS